MQGGRAYSELYPGQLRPGFSKGVFPLKSTPGGAVGGGRGGNQSMHSRAGAAMLDRWGCRAHPLPSPSPAAAWN